MFFPLVLLFIYKLIKEKKCSWIVLTIAMVGILNSHIISLYITFIILLLVCIFKVKDILKEKLILIDFLKAIFFTICISLYFLAPMIEQINSQRFVFNNGSVWGDIDLLAFKLLPADNIFIKLLIIAILSIMLLAFLYKTKLYKNNIITTLIFVTFTSIILTTNIAPWEYIKKIPYISNVQFPWRLFMITSITTPYLIIEISKTHKFVIENMKLMKRAISICIIFIGFLIVMLMYIFQPVGRNVVLYTGNISGAEYLPDNYDYNYLLEKTYFCGNEEGSYTFEKLGDINVINKEEAIIHNDIQLPIIYYKGYKAYVDRKNEDLISLYRDKNGMVSLDIKGSINDKIIVKYENTLIQKVSIFISVISINVFIFIILKKTKDN